MVLLLPINATIAIIIRVIFTFQYGATSTTLSSNIIPKMSWFTFQYGATSTNVIVATPSSLALFTFQYGATSTQYAFIFTSREP